MPQLQALLLVGLAPDRLRLARGVRVQRFERIEEDVDRDVVKLVQLGLEAAAERAVRVAEHVERAPALAVDADDRVLQRQLLHVDPRQVRDARGGEVVVGLHVHQRAVHEIAARAIRVGDLVAHHDFEEPLDWRRRDAGERRLRVFLLQRGEDGLGLRRSGVAGAVQQQGGCGEAKRGFHDGGSALEGLGRAATLHAQCDDPVYCRDPPSPTGYFGPCAVTWPGHFAGPHWLALGSSARPRGGTSPGKNILRRARHA